MQESKINLIAKFFTRTRMIGTPGIIFEADDLYDKIYLKHRISDGFEKARVIANVAVIKFLNGETLRERGTKRSL